MTDTTGSLEQILEERRTREPEAVETVEPDTPETVETPEAETVEPETVEADPEVEAVEVEAVEAINAPTYWPADKKAEFAKLPPELQALVAEQEQGRVAAVNKAQQEATEARKSLTAEAERLAQVASQVQAVVDMAEQQHKRVIPELGMTWDEVDWPAWFAQDRLTAAQFRAQYDLEQSELQRITSAKQQAEQLEYDQFLKAEMAKIPELVPALIDPKEGPKRFQALQSHLVERGISQDRLKFITAAELSIAYDAMQWRQAQAKAQALQSTPRTAAPAPRPVRPSGGVPPQDNTLQALEARAARTGSLDDVLALRRARRKA